MSSKSTQRALFANQRNYAHISQIEQTFFRGLASQRGQFSGQNSSVTTAVNKAMPFIQSGARLDIIVDFHVAGRRVDVDHMYLGTLLKPHADPKSSLVTHFIALTKGEDCKLKIHMDLDFDLASPEPKPSPHLQIGGGSLPVCGNVFSVKWDPDLDKPRWPSLPFCTPLLWNAAFLEFQECSSVAAFVGKGWWVNLVKEAERALWGPFADDIKSGILRNTCLMNALYPTSMPI